MGRIYYTMHLPAHNSRSQTGTPGASRTQYVAGGHRESAVHTVRRVPLVALLPDSPAVLSRVQLSSAEMGVLAAQHTRWWSFFTLLQSFILSIKTLRYQRDSPYSDLVAPEVYNLSDLDWADIKVLCDIVMAFKLAQETLDGELYITGSRVVAILGKIRANVILTRLEWADSEKGTRVLTFGIKGFETRFGDSSNVCEVDCEGPSRQPRGYTKVSQ